MKIYVLSHTDADGYFSAALVEFFNKIYYNTPDVTHKSWTYGRGLPKIKNFSKKYDKVYIVDLIPDYDFMDALIDEMGVGSVVWCDHHETKDREYEAHIGKNILGVRTSGHDSAVVAVWRYFLTGCNAHVETPDWLRMISDYDTWNIKSKDWADRVLPYSFFIRNNISSVKDAYEYLLLITKTAQPMTFMESLISEDVSSGMKSQKIWDAIYKKEVGHGFERQINFRTKTGGEQKTYKALVVNTQNRGSYMFTLSNNKDDYDVFIAYSFNGSVYKYSIYSFNTDIKCNNLIINNIDEEVEFCGHDDAAGAMSKTSIFDNK